jgi:hypothetical protein
MWLVPFAVLLVGVGATVLVYRLGVRSALVSAPLIACGVLATLVDRLLDRRRTERAALPEPRRLTDELLERWRMALLVSVKHTRVGDQGQLSKMVREGDPIDVNVARVDHDSGRPRVRVGGRLVAWSEMTRRWDASPGRLVILGDPGYGKTVAALTLVKHINARDEPGCRVAEVFSLAEWQRWCAMHADAPLGHWLAEQLTVAHPGVGLQVARELIDAELILPVLDGLDEIASVEHRRACVEAIDAYAGHGEPHRPFVLTCRAREYRELAPDWVRDDDCVVLVGLQADQIKQRLHEQTAGCAAWDALRERQAAGGGTLNTLLASPLRLAIALQVYRCRDPGELLELSDAQARERLWELLLDTNADYDPNATPAQVRAWLAWLAVGLRRMGRQRFMLHELSLLDVDSARSFRRFRVVLALTSALTSVLVLGLLGGLLDGVYFNLVRRSRPDVTFPIFDLVEGLIIGLFCGGLVGLSTWLGVGSQPSIRTRLQRRAQLRSALVRKALVRRLARGLLVALPVGLVVGLIAGVTPGLIFGFGAEMSTLFLGLALVGTDVILAEPPTHFAFMRPDAVLMATRSSGWAGASAGGLAGGLAGALINELLVLIGGADDADWLADALYVGLAWALVFALAFGLVGALVGGLDAWLYHYWLRWSLCSRGLLPSRLPAFLDWCACDDRGWLRVSDAYEFRHRELLEHLARETTPAN